LIDSDALIININLAATKLIDIKGGPGGVYYRQPVSGQIQRSGVKQEESSWDGVIEKSLGEVLPWLAEVIDSIKTTDEKIFHKQLKVEIDQQTKYFMITISGMLDISGKYEGAVVVVSDISYQKNAQEFLKTNEERLMLATQAGGIGVWEWDILKNNLVWDNRMLELYNVHVDDFNGVYEAWKSRVHPDDLTASKEEFNNAMKTLGRLDWEFRIIWPNGEIRYIKANALTQSDESGRATRMIGVNWDITKRKQMEDAIRKLASTDVLTGISNRRSFLEHAENELIRCQRYQHKLSALMIDIDHFKKINDTYGHHIGDITLQVFTQTCLNTFRENDIFGRIGGEEFAVILVETDEKKAAQVAERLRKILSKTTVTKGKFSFNFQVSIGVAAIQDCEELIEDILKKADKALYMAKNLGRNRVVAASEFK